MTKLTNEELLLISKLLEMAGDQFSNHGCNDMPQEIWDEVKFPPAARATLIHEMQEWNGDKEEPYPRKLEHIRDDSAMHFYADKLQRMAEGAAGEASQGDLLAALKGLLARIDKVSDLDEGCLYINGRSAGEFKEPIEAGRIAIKNFESGSASTAGPRPRLETMNSSEPHCLGTFWTDQEIAVIDALAKRQDFSHVAVLRNALRNYQLAVEGTPDVGELANSKPEDVQLDVEAAAKELADDLIDNGWVDELRDSRKNLTRHLLEQLALLRRVSGKGAHPGWTSIATPPEGKDQDYGCLAAAPGWTIWAEYEPETGKWLNATTRTEIHPQVWTEIPMYRPSPAPVPATPEPFRKVIEQVRKEAVDFKTNATKNGGKKAQIRYYEGALDALVRVDHLLERERATTQGTPEPQYAVLRGQRKVSLERESENEPRTHAIKRESSQKGEEGK